MLVYLVRHGERYDYTDVSWGKQAAYPHDSHLSPIGETQAQDLADRLANARPAMIVLTHPHCKFSLFPTTSLSVCVCVIFRLHRRFKEQSYRRYLSLADCASLCAWNRVSQSFYVRTPEPRCQGSFRRRCRSRLGWISITSRFGRNSNWRVGPR